MTTTCITARPIYLAAVLFVAIMSVSIIIAVLLIIMCGLLN